MPEFIENHVDWDDAGGLPPIAESIGDIISAAARCSAMKRPFPARMGRLARELRGEAYRPVLVWKNPIPCFEGRKR